MNATSSITPSSNAVQRKKSKGNTLIAILRNKKAAYTNFTDAVSLQHITNFCVLRLAGRRYLHINKDNCLFNLGTNAVNAVQPMPWLSFGLFSLFIVIPVWV
jgi:endo-1,4-beta-D-glucanase Y